MTAKKKEKMVIAELQDGKIIRCPCPEDVIENTMGEPYFRRTPHQLVKESDLD